MCCPAPLFFFDVLGSNWGQNRFFAKNEPFHTTQKRQQKARNLDKVPKLRAFLPFQLLLIIGLLVAGARFELTTFGL